MLHMTKMYRSALLTMTKLNNYNKNIPHLVLHVSGAISVTIFMHIEKEGYIYADSLYSKLILPS